MRISLGFVTLVAAFTAIVLLGVAEPTAVELARSIQSKCVTVREFSTDFVHSYTSVALRKQLTERGHLLIKKPGKMRWEYTAPEHKLFVSDGVKIYSYIPED